MLVNAGEMDHLLKVADSDPTLAGFVYPDVVYSLPPSEKRKGVAK